MRLTRLVLALVSLAFAACHPPRPSGAPEPAARSARLAPPAVEACDAEPVEAAELEALAFSSRERCEALLEGGRLYPRPERHVRFGTWNIRFFPDGGPRGPHKPTDVEWLACAIAFLQIDVLAVQEFLAPSTRSGGRIAERTAALLARLEELTGHPWGLVLDECEPNRPDRQHVGLLFDRERVELTRARHVSRMNPDGGCKHLRPGLAADVRAPGGLDLHVVSFHGKAYGDARSRARREHVYASMQAIAEEIRLGASETDLLLLGDFNTVGCEECASPETASDEARALARAAESAGLALVERDGACSHYWDREGSFGVLDHVVADASMRELERSVHVSGFCAAAACAYHGGAAHTALSDHCPLFVDLIDEDRDPAEVRAE